MSGVSDPTQPESAADAGSPAAFGSRSRRGPLRRVLVRLGQLLLTVVVTAFILQRLGPGIGDLSGEIAVIDVRWGWIAASCAALALGYGVSGWIWGRMVEDLGGPHLAPADSVRIFLVANLGRYVPGKLWQIAGLALLARRRGVTAPVATAAALVGQAVSLAGAMLIGLIALAHAPPPLGRLAPFAGVATAVVVLTVTIPGIFRPLLRFAIRFVPGEKPAEIPIGAVEGLRWLALYTLNWGGYALAFWLLMRGLSLPIPALVAGPAFSAAYVLGYLAVFAPAGLGVREGSMIALLTPAVGGPGAAFVALAARVWTTAVEVIPAGAFWLAGVGRRGQGTS